MSRSAERRYTQGSSLRTASEGCVLTAGWRMGGATWMSSTSLVLQLPASSASLLSHQQVTGEEQQRDRGDPVPVLMDKAWWELLEHLNK